MEREIKLEIEELEERIAPTPLAVNPSAANGHAPSIFTVGAQSGPFTNEVDLSHADDGLIMAASRAGGVIVPG